MSTIVVLALLSPAGAAWCTGSGIVAHPQQIRSVEQAHIAQFLRRMPFSEADKELAAGSAVFIDARYAVDFSNGHLPGAINIPVTTSAAMASAMLAGERRDARLVVYCQSKSCPFSKVVAGNLLREGYTSVELLDGGWEEWSAWKH